VVDTLEELLVERSRRSMERNLRLISNFGFFVRAFQNWNAAVA
jgi:hypothetical protein